ncbi:hypothetical protein DN069_25335 [Streptacidiphilus pinicola]|uniref:Glycosyltransferase RgtA/B/C/D-like domain-containing protein n=1 Tax=Streptacidiphilus pinicola TaxID=2219663 RepID=A0A2X0ID18_9ACTN|nr:hypothetical protein [Streptacidiphilus pinicola]RAG82884.1 hypothetical protein DN069_25335 [Streptacidiphilus pinicola]
MPALLFLLFVLVQLLALPASSFSNDSYRYDLLARQFSGESAVSARLAANADYCAEMARQDYRGQLLLPAAGSFPAPVKSDGAICRARLGATVLPPNDPRYTRIFSTRPGYPLLAAPFVALLGGPTGLRVVSVLLTGLAGTLVFATLRVVLPSARRLVAGTGQVLCCLTPLGTYGVRPLSEGAALFCLTAGLLGVALCGDGRRPRLWAGGALLAAAYLALGFVRYAEALPLALVTVLGAAVCLALPRRRSAGAVVVGAVSLAAFVGLAVAGGMLRLPSLTLSLDDLFSAHFTQPLAPDPRARLAVLNLRMWWQWAQSTALVPALPVALVLGVLGLRRAPGPVAAYTASCAVTGIAAVVAHPLAYEAERLMLPIWLPIVVGLPLWLASVNFARRVDEHPSSRGLASTRL